MQRLALRALREERLPTEQENKKLQAMPTLIARQGEQPVVVAGDVQGGGQVDLKEPFRDRTRALIVKPPMRAVGQDTPAHSACRKVVRAAQVAKHLRGRCHSPIRGSVERSKPAFGLHHYGTNGVARPLLRYTDRSRLGGIVDEQQPVRHIRSTHATQVLLAQVCGPVQTVESLPDQVVFGLALIRRAVAGEEPRRQRASDSLLRRG